MPDYLRLFVAAVLFLIGQTAVAVVPVELRCEYLRNPVGIDLEQPRLSWRMDDPKGVRGQAQAAYEVSAASSLEALTQGQPDLWDSGIVQSSQSVLVPYAGQPLTSNQAVYWQVRVHDKDGTPSPWSEPARFVMGLLDPEDWQGSWIHHPTAPVEKHIWWRRNLSIDQPVQSAVIHIASLGYHELFINGEKVADHHLAPAASRIDRRVLYLSYDIADLLKPGANTIAIWHGPGWARYPAFDIRPAIRAQLQATLADGQLLNIATDTDWRCAISSSENIGNWRWGDMGGERIDARLHVEGWNGADFDDSGWETAAGAEFDIILTPQMMAPTRKIQEIAAQSIQRRDDGSYRVDMGMNFSGFLEVRMRGLEGGGEVLLEVANRQSRARDFGQRNRFISAGAEEEMFRNRFNFIAGRYVTISGLKEEPQLADITGFALSTGLERTGMFNSSNPLLNDIYETDLWTWRANLIEGYTTDCPHRARGGYGEAAFACAWGIAFPGYDAAAMYIKHVRDWADMQRNNGWIPHAAPQFAVHSGGPMWSSAGLNIAWAHYQNYGDPRVLEINYPSARRWLEFLHRHRDDGLLRRYSSDWRWRWFLGDWAAPGSSTNVREEGDPEVPRYFNNCVYALNLQQFVAMAKVLGHDEDAQLYQDRLDALRKRIHAVYYDPDTQLYSQGTQVELAFALLVGVPPVDLRPTVEASFQESLRARPYFQMGGSGLPILMKYLIEHASCNQIAYEYLNRTEEPSYGYFLERGENTWPEFWTVDVPSRMHTCFTGISSWMMKGVAGIRLDPAHPGYQRFLIQPVIGGDLTFAEGESKSLYGRIASRWEYVEGELTLNVTIPPNSRATVQLPTLGTPAEQLVIREGDQVIWQDGRSGDSLPDGIAFFGKDGESGPSQRIAWDVAAGQYQFTLNPLSVP